MSSSTCSCTDSDANYDHVGRFLRSVASAVFKAALLYGCCLTATVGLAAAPEDEVRESIRQRLEWLTSGSRKDLSGEPLVGVGLAAEIYTHAQHRPIWRDRGQIEQLWDASRLAEAQGLDPADYPLSGIRALLPGSGLPEAVADRVDLDLLATEALIRISFQLRFGKLNPEDESAVWNVHRELLKGVRNTETIADIMASNSLADRLAVLFDRGPRYGRWIEMLARYREMRSRGDWPAVSPGTNLSLGDGGVRVMEIKRRIAATQEFGNGRSDIFDAELERSVREFQGRHGLSADGIVGPRTLAAMNVTIDERIGQIRAALERARWVFDDFGRTPQTMVLINIASARVQLLRGWQPIFSARTVTGHPGRETPTFRDEVDYLVFNPTWIVPPTILEQDILPAVRRDGPAYLEARHMEVLDEKGTPINPTRVDWSVRLADDFPYSIRQKPGPWNQLGRIKFVFPNSRFIFMHDTPNRELFGLSCRALSSGCIRVESPFQLAELLLDDPARWNPAAFDALLEPGTPQVVHLPDPVPIILLYSTADVGEEGAACFYDDVYGRDLPLLEALDAPPIVRQ
jgi:murein L,D-transpeptidase YcbB/YkuD